MTGLTNGYVIPRLPSYVRVPGVRVEPKGHGNALAVLVARARAPPSGDSHGDVDGDRIVRQQYALIFGSRCIHCRDFHHPTNYCFRLKHFKMPKRRRHQESETESSQDEEGQLSSREDTESGSEREEDAASENDAADDALAAKDEFGPPVGGKNLSAFYKGKKRADAHDVKLVIQPETFDMYFSDLLGDGKLDIQSARELYKKYYVSESDYKRLSPPTLSDTKLNIIQKHAAGGIYNKLQGIHNHVRQTLKIFLRSYEVLGACDEAFKEFKADLPYSGEDTVVEKYLLPAKGDIMTTITDDEVDIRSRGEVISWSR